MISSVLHGIWRWCPLHQWLGAAFRSAGFGKRSPLIESNFGASRRRATKEGESTLLPMLITGLVTVVAGITIAAFFV
jgi:hypothetical protein